MAHDDNYYSDEFTIRLRYGFHSEETRADEPDGNTVIKLNNRAYSITQIEKNGAVLAPSGFTFQPPIRISLVTPIVNPGDIFFFVYGTKLPSSMIRESLEHATETIDGILFNNYETDLPIWKQYKITHGAVVGGPFVVGETITGQDSGGEGEVIKVESDFLIYLPTQNTGITGAGGLLPTEVVIGGTSLASATLTGDPDSLAPGLITKIATELAGCYAKEILWAKIHSADPDEMLRNEKTKMYYLKQLDYIDKGKIKLKGAVSSGKTDRPVIGRPMHRRLFNPGNDVNETDYFRDYTPLNPGGTTQ